MDGVKVVVPVLVDKPGVCPAVVKPVIVAKIGWLDDLEGFIETHAYSQD